MRTGIFRLAAVAAVVMAQTASAQGPRFATGLDFADAATYQGIPLASTPLMGVLPPSVDMSRGFPTPGDQGSQSSCVAWAVAYALKSYQEGIEHHWTLDADHTFSPAFIYNQIHHSTDCKGGTSLVDALNMLRRDGVPPLSSFPYVKDSCSAQPSAAVKQMARSFSIADWRRVNVQDETEIKNNLSAGFPVMLAIEVDDAFMNLKGDAVYNKFVGPSRGGHAIVAVGYDDQRQAVKLLNSWGTGWGDDGFGWVSYPTIRAIAREGYVAQDIVTNTPPPVDSSVPAFTPPEPGPTPTPTPPTNGRNSRPPTTRPQPIPGHPPDALVPRTMVTGIQIAPVANVVHPRGLPSGPGLAFAIQGTVTNAAGHTIQMVVRFLVPQTNQWLVANVQEPSYRDATGFVATGTQSYMIYNPLIQLNAVTETIPYYALNLIGTNYTQNYPLYAVAAIYIDNFEVARSQPVPFSVRW